MTGWDRCPTCGGVVPVRAGVRVDRDAKAAVVEGRVIRLTTREAQILAALEDTYPHVATTDHLMLRLYGARPLGQPSVVKIHISALRRHLAGTGWTIANLHGRGYRLTRAEWQPPKSKEAPPALVISRDPRTFSDLADPR